MKKRKTLLSLLIAAALIFGTVFSPLSISAAENTDTGPSVTEITASEPEVSNSETAAENGITASLEGDGSTENPYLIKTENDLLYAAQQMNASDASFTGKSYKLMSDITLTQEFPMINRFSGTFDGNGYTVSNVIINSVYSPSDSSTKYSGFFRVNEGTVSNLNLKDVQMTCSGNSGQSVGPSGGCLAGQNTGTIEKCSVTGTNSAPDFEKAAGLVGENSSGNAKITDCSFSGQVTGFYMAGGIACYGKGTIEHCIANADITTTSTVSTPGRTGQQKGNDAGIICGYCGNPLTIKNCAAYGGKITVSYPDFAIDGYEGRILGFNGNSGLTLTDNIASDAIQIGSSASYTTVSSTDASSQQGADKTAAELAQQSTYETLGFDFTGTWEMDAENGIPKLKDPKAEQVDPGDPGDPGEPEDPGVTSLSGSGTSSDPYMIGNEDELRFFISQVNAGSTIWSDSKYYALSSDIALTGETTELLDSFKGTLDGKGHKISGFVYHGAITDVSSPGNFRGALIKKNYGTIKDLTLNNVNVTCTGGNGNSGGPSLSALVCENESGGLIQRCAVTGTIYAPEFEKVGGVSALNLGGTIQNCYFEGNVTGYFMAAGITVYNNNNGLIKNNFAIADITLLSNAVTNGRTNTEQGNDGAIIVAYPNRADIEGNVAYDGKITYSYAQPGAATAGYFGRIVGFDGYSKTVKNNIANKEITINGQTVSGSSGDQNGADKTADDLQKQSTYEALGWDFSYTWSMDETSHHPVLKYVDSSSRPDRITVTFFGDSKTEKAITWYTETAVASPVVRYGTKSDLSDAVSITADSADINGNVRHQARITGLAEDTTYYYKVGDAETGIFSATGKFKTAGSSGAFSFINLADTQAYSESDAQISGATMLKALQTDPDAAFILHGGDIVDDGNSENMWIQMLDNASAALMNTTIAPAAGNHESSNNSFVNHFFLEQNGPSEGGTYYSFDYNNAHFVVLNTNEDSTQCVSQTQLDWLKNDVTQARANGAEWVILNLHKGPYSTANHMDDSDVKAERRVLVPLIDELDIDLVLEGHDHILSRTKVLRYDAGGTECASAAETTKITEVKAGKRIEYALSPEGTIYFLCDTAGVKHYSQNSDPDGIELSKYLELFDRTDQGVGNGDKNCQYFADIKIDGGRLTAMVYQIKNQAVPFSWEGFGIDRQIMPVVQMIDALPASDSLTLADEASVAAARSAYDSLDYEQRKGVSDYDKLTGLEDRLAELKSEAAGELVWYDAEAQARQLISVRNDEDETFENTPVLLKITGIPEGTDSSTLKFYSLSGLALPYEIENWDPAATTSVWVKIPSIPAAGSAEIWAYYGGAAAENDPADVWNDNYELVEHFAGDSASGDLRTDSTGKQTGTVSGNGFTSSVSPAATKYAYFDTTKIAYGDVGAGYDQVSVSAIYQASSDDVANQPEANSAIFAKDIAGAGSGDTLFLGINKNNKKLVARYNGIWYENGGTASREGTPDLPEDGKEHLVTLSYDGMTVTVFVDGEKKYESFHEYRTTLSDDDTPSTIGAYSNKDIVKASYRGYLDEVELLSYRTTPAYEAFRYSNLFGDAVKYGTLETKGSSSGTLIISTPKDGEYVENGKVTMTGVLSRTASMKSVIGGKENDLGKVKAGRFTIDVPVNADGEQDIILKAGNAQDKVSLIFGDTAAPDSPQLSEDPVSTPGSVPGTDPGSKTGAELSADVISAAGEEVTTRFYLNETVPLTAKNTEVRYGSTQDKLPDNISPTDGEKQSQLFGTSTATDENTYQIFRIDLNDEQAAQPKFHLTWTGTAERKVSAYVYDTKNNRWNFLGSAYDQDSPEVSIRMDIENSDVLSSDGKLTILIWRGMTEAIENRDSYHPDAGDFDFGMVAVPDSQLYTQTYPEQMVQMFEYIAETAKENKTAFVVHEGDVVNRPYLNQSFQWESASAGFKVLEDAGIPYGIAWGNHDYDNGVNNRVRYYEYFPESRMKAQAGSLWGDSYNAYDPSKPIDDAYYLLEEHGVKIMVLTVSFWYTDDDIAWCKKAIEDHSDYAVIIVTHNYLGNGNVSSNNKIYTQLAKPNKNVKLILNGHVAGVNERVTDFGDHQVYNVLADYQGLPYGGYEFIRNMQFDLENDLIYFNTYSPLTGETLSPYGSGSYDDVSSSRAAASAADGTLSPLSNSSRGDLYQIAKDEFAIAVDMGGSTVRTLTTSSMTMSAGNDTQIGTDQTVNKTGKVTVTADDLSVGTTYEYFATVTDKSGNVTRTDAKVFTAVPANHVHTLKKTEAKAPTETEPGNIEYWTCTGCGKIFKDKAGTIEITEEETVIPATGTTTQEPGSKPDTGDTGTNDRSDGSGNSAGGTDGQNNSVNTGDHAQAETFAISGICTLILICVLLRRNKRSRTK